MEWKHFVWWTWLWNYESREIDRLIVVSRLKHFYQFSLVSVSQSNESFFTQLLRNELLNRKKTGKISEKKQTIQLSLATTPENASTLEHSLIRKSVILF